MGPREDKGGKLLEESERNEAVFPTPSISHPREREREREKRSRTAREREKMGMDS